MKKVPSRKPPTASTLPRKKKPVAGKAGQIDKGFENIGKKRIPFVRFLGERGHIQTHYGSHDFLDLESLPMNLSSVTKYESPGFKAWNVMAQDRVRGTGKATNKLQGLLGNADANFLFNHVRLIRDLRRPVQPPLKKFSNFTEEDIAGKIVPFLLRDIAAGGTHFTLMLAKCIEAAVAREEQTIAEKILEATASAANRYDRLPTKREVQLEFDKDFQGVDDGNFSRGIAAAGLAWLPTKL